MSTLDKATLIAKLQSLYDKPITLNSTQVDDVVSSALSTRVLDEINLIFVNSVNELPNLKYYESPDGIICFVNDLGVFAISSQLRWITLDGRLLRTDTSYTQLWMWGENLGGGIGDGTTDNRSSPVQVLGGFTDWCQIDSGGTHGIALKTNGTLWSWGCNGDGRLGDGTTIFKSSPVQVAGGFTDWCRIERVMADHTFVFRSNGTVWGWGSNGQGRLGDNSTVNKSSPVQLLDVFSDWTQISPGQQHSLGLRSNGTIWAWGLNSSGQLGDNTVIAKSSPVSVVGEFCDWCQLSSGSIHSLGLRTNGTLWAWGNNGSGRLGDGTTIFKSSPVQVAGGFTDWCYMNGANIHSLGQRSNGTLWSWGCNGQGRLGDNTTTNRSSPVSVVGGFTDWCCVEVKEGHVTALRSNGTLWAWGRNPSGELGDGTTISTSSPVSVIGGFTDWYQISAGWRQSIGIRRIC
jgi:alpha-tubulin suppressor-like RCC1 family protein